MRQQTIEDYLYNPDIIKAVGKLLGSGSYAVSKPVRAGFTTSAILAAQRAGLTVLFLAPTNAIIKDTVGKVARKDSSVRVPANIECQILKEKAAIHPLLRYVPLPLPDCQDCPHRPSCTVLDIIKMDDPGLICMTYSKLAAIQHSSSSDSKEVLNKLSKQAVIIMDEAHTLSRAGEIAVEAGRQLEIPPGYPRLQGIYNKWLDFNESYAADIQELLDKSDNFASKYLAKKLSIVAIQCSDEKPEAWRELRDIACNDGMNQDDLTAMLNIVALMNSLSITLQFQHEDDKKSVLVTSGRSEQAESIKDFLQDYGARADHIYVSGTLYEPHPGYFKELSGRDIVPVVFPDFQKANNTIVLIPDRWKLTSWNFARKLPEIIDTIEAISEKEQQPILVYAPSKAKAAVIRQKVEERGIPDIKVDYYRSSLSMGVESKYRICIAIGMAETPSNCCDSMAVGNNEYDMWFDSGCIRLQGVHADTWQAINRVKDPSGKVPSKVYMIGCRVEQLRELSKWGNNRRIIVDDIDFKAGSDGQLIYTRIYKIAVDEMIDPSPIAGEEKNDTKSERRTLKDYIGGIEDYYNNNEINSENRDISSIDTSRENVVLFGIYNNPLNKNELDITVESLRSMFMNRADAYGRQYKVEGGASWSKVIGSMSDEKLIEHIQGRATYGSYQLGLDDTVIWACLDIDSHEGNRPITDEVIEQTRADVKNVVAVLRRYNVPFLLEASGSPGSYHVWIFLSRTKTYNAYRFIRQVKAEAGIKCEVFPKQKTFGKDGKYGNLVKIPICANQKCGGRSVFLNPDTFEPIEGVIEHPGRVRLLEVPEPGKKGKDALVMPRRAHRMPQDGAEFDPCMEKLLADKVALEGSEGHEMRVAIAIKAGLMGMSDEEVARVFADQPDYNHEISLSKVIEIRGYGYKPYSCAALKDKCGGLVEQYCGQCKCRG